MSSVFYYIKAKRKIILYAVLVYLIVFSCCLIIAKDAHAMSFYTATKLFANPFNLVAFILTEMCVSFIDCVLAPITSCLLDWGVDYTEIPFVNMIILWLQGFAILAVVVVRIVQGFHLGIFAKGGQQDVSTGEYLFKSIVALIIVALMPMLCRSIIEFGKAMYQNIFVDSGQMAVTTNLQEFFDISSFNGTLFADDVDVNINFGAMLFTFLGIIVILVLLIAVGYQFIRRQLEMITVSLIAPLVSIYSATETQTDQAYRLLTKLFGLCCMQWIQYLFCMIAVGVAESWITIAFSSDVTNMVGFSASNNSVQLFMFAICTLMFSLHLPQLINEFTYHDGGTRTGSVVMGAMVGTGVRGGIRTGLGAGAKIIGK